ncbi:L,D-transpeptidase family protein [Litoreibacter janthinus]|uniref:L,D-transpeptidase catalytic domain n=1 Tax=Litoreibacter janthinus TaxID=670154 RepID=A0A1I6G0W2_9RHOB|nr:L,D-transpeptidase family protein [Litoreibacter janthinus]SFR35791.1 L,D-transpeptidase catalytic domain [Litoreibacter janthinus]
MRSVLFRGLVLASLLILSACSSKFITYNGPQVTKLEVHKGQRTLKVFSGNRVLKTYKVDLGFGAEGHKRVEGDGRTPEGRYTIDRRNPNSSFYLSLGISYPNTADRAYAQSIGKSPGGDIFIHGEANKSGRRGPDWTAGCIAIRNKEMRLLYAMVKNGTVIDIFP